VWRPRWRGSSLADTGRASGPTERTHHGEPRKQRDRSEGVDILERGSDKHSPRVDEELDHETRSLRQGAPVESRVEEHREQEGPGDGQPTPDARLAGGPAAGARPAEGRDAGATLDLDDAEIRADIARFLTPSVFPADRDALVADAEGNHAPDEVLERLRVLPAGRAYGNVEDVWAALGGTVEHRF
jgi:Protein of unknown function (DUF2795)